MTGTRGSRYLVESVELESWSAVVRDDERRTVVGSAKTNALSPGPGPGELTWERDCDGGLPALRATCGTGHFKILPVSSAMFALFFAQPERDLPLGVGSVEGLKHAASTHKPTFVAPAPSPPPPAPTSPPPIPVPRPPLPIPTSGPASSQQPRSIFLKSLRKR